MENQQETIFLKDIFYFDELLSREEFKRKRIKLRFNTDWEGFSFVDGYVKQSEDFLPWILSRGSDKKSRNAWNDIQFQFIQVEWHKWLFVRAYVILERDSQVHTNGVKFARAERIAEYDKFIGKVLVSWKNSPQSFYYTSHKIINSVEIISISQQSYFEQHIEFPGFENISLSYSELKKHILNSEWRNQLSSVYGVYVITDKKTGKLYVGSAYGDVGIYGRWSIYLSGGFDKTELENSQYPNKRLRELVNAKGMTYIQKHFQYSILEIFSKNELGKQKALQREQYWKQVLQSRNHGYNEN